MSVVAVAVIGLFFIPHWTAVLFVIAFISFLYVNMLGFLYLSGVQINAISYVTLVMSIGLMIDVSIRDSSRDGLCRDDRILIEFLPRFAVHYAYPHAIL